MARYNPRKVKIHRAYRIEEAAELFAVHKRTIANWIKDGLQVCSRERPMLILGKDLRQYLEKRHKESKKPCRPGQIYCVACKAPQNPTNNFAILTRLTHTLGSLAGKCPTCHRKIQRRVSLQKISTCLGSLMVSRIDHQERVT